jgi:hypothetical protein
MKGIRFCALLFFLLCFASAGAQYDSTYYTADMFSDRIGELRIKHGYKKYIPAEYELPVLVALSHYPELDSVPIDFTCLPIQTTMMAQPHTSTLFAGLGHRTYAIFINTSKKNTGFVPTELSFNQLVGVIGHELGHISYYSRQHTCGLLMDAFGYYFRNYRRSFEKGTDLIAIEHGLGWQLFDFEHCVQHEMTLSKSYAKKKKSTYMTDDEIHAEVRRKR